MSVSEDRKYSKSFIFSLLENVKGKTLGEVDKSNQFSRCVKSSKITGIAGDVIEQSVFGYERDSKQECDIEIDGILTELKTTGVRIKKCDLPKVRNKQREEYNTYLCAKEGISITGVTFEPNIQTDFQTSHFWEKAEHLLIVFYEYKSYEVVPAAEYANFPIIDYCYNSFSENEQNQLRNDWEIVRDYLINVYNKFSDQNTRYQELVGFTHNLRPRLLLLELVPGLKKRNSDKKNPSYQKPRYRLKQTFVDYIVKGHFNKTRQSSEISLKNSFSSFEELEKRCHDIKNKYGGMDFATLKDTLNIQSDITSKDFASKCILKMFEANCKRLNDISDFTKAGIIAKTITVTPTGSRTEDMKLKYVDFAEWNDRDIDFEESEIYTYFCEHSFLCPIFCERGDMSARHKDETESDYKKRLNREIKKATFEGFKRFSFDDNFIQNQVKKTWSDSRALVHKNELVWVFEYDRNGEKRVNKSGSYMGAPNLPKSSDYVVFFRGGANDSSNKAKTITINGIKMLPQYIWIKGSFIAEKLKSLPYL